MPDNVVDPAGATGEKTALTSTTSATTNEVKPEALTLDSVKSLFTEMLGPVAAKIRHLEKGTRAEAVPNPSEEKTLTQRLAALEVERVKTDKLFRSTRIEQEAAELGVPTSRMKAFKTLVEAEYGTKLVRSDDDLVFKPDPNNALEDKPLKGVLASFLQSPDGEMFRAAVQTPGGKGLRAGITQSNGKRYTNMSIEERLKLSPTEAAALAAQER